MRSMLTLIKGGQVYSPQKLGELDILIAGAHILAIGKGLSAPVGFAAEVTDATGKIVIPGYIDCHMHPLGAGGGNGPASRAPEIGVSAVAKAGVTTFVGTLGINTVGLSPKTLLLTLHALESQGISTLMYTGCYHYPPATVTGSLTDDVALIEKIVGVKIALFDILSSHPSKEDLKELASRVWLGGRMGGKPGLLHAHIGETGGDTKEIADLLVSMGLPPSMFVTTHVNRNDSVLRMSIEAGLAGVSLDITALYTPDIGLPETIYPAAAYKEFLKAGIPLESLTISSDGNGVQPIKNEEGVITRIEPTAVDAVAREIRTAVHRFDIALEDILPLATTNAAGRLGIAGKKGSLEVGKDADIVLLDKNLEVDTVYARGKLMVKDKIPTVIGHFEKQR